MRCAVVTPYYQEPLWMLQRAHDSVRSQEGAPVHVLVADGHPRSEVDDWDAVHLTLPRSHGDNGNTPRSLGARWAREQGFEQVTFLDADNWYLEGHLDGLQDLAQQTQADLLVSGRIVVAPDGQRLPSARHASVRAGGHADTSTLLLQGGGLALADFWDQMPRKLSPMCDQVFCHAARARGLSIAQTPAETLAFTSRYAPHFLSAGRPPPADCTAMRSLTRATQIWKRLPPAVRSAILLGQPLPPADPLPAITVLLAVPDTLPASQLAVLQQIAAAAGPQLSVQRVAPPPGVPVDRYTAQLLAQVGPDWRPRVLVVAASAALQGRALQQAALATLDADQHWQQPRLLVLQPGAVAQPPLEADRLQQEAWRVLVLTAAHKARFHAHCPSGDGHVVNASNPAEVQQLLTDLLTAPGDFLGVPAVG